MRTMYPNLDTIEEKRLLLQQKLDTEKTSQQRNILGQFATPTDLAIEILHYAQTLIPDSEPIRFLDPAFGTGAFYSALLRAFSTNQIERAWGFEVDQCYGENAIKFWADDLLKLNLADFTKATPPLEDNKKFNLVICNPPYVRHHHIDSDDKPRLRKLVQSYTNYRLNGLAGLYTYFMLLSQIWMSPNGLAGWLVPSEFLDVNYGKEVKRFLLKHVTLLQIHRFNPKQSQFDDALVSSVVVWFKNSPPKQDHHIKFSYGGQLLAPEESTVVAAEKLTPNEKWTKLPLIGFRSKPHKNIEKKIKLSELFTIKRGIATGANKFFILTPEQVSQFKLPEECLKPILPSPRYLDQFEIEADEYGLPKIRKLLFLLDCKLPESVVEQYYPSVWRYLQLGVEQGIHQRYLSQHRSPWYAQEVRPPAPILCTYMGRVNLTKENPFRFIMNKSRATAPNVYLLMYPKPALDLQLKNNPDLLRLIWQEIRQISPIDLISEGRIYGGGLHKIEPNELANAAIRDVVGIDDFKDGLQLSMF